MKTFETEIWVEGFEGNLIYQTDESSFRDAYNRAMKTINTHKKYGRNCKLIRVQKK